MAKRIACLVVVTIVALTLTSNAQGDDIFLQFMASDGNWADQSFTGHAFVCVQLKTGTGLKEDCFGFYPRTTGGALVGGPGVVDSEFNFTTKPPTRFSNVKASLTKTITVEQRQKVLAFIKEFDKNFSLTSTNCVFFANDVAKLVGLKTPPSTSFSTPVQYLNELRKLNPGT